MEKQSSIEQKIYGHLSSAFKLEEDGDIAGAIDEFKAAAELGSADAQSKLGTIFDDIVKPARPKEAVYWYKKAVRAGDGSCAWNLAMHYKEHANRRRYLYWLRVAERMGDPDSKKELETREWWNKRNAR